MTYGLYTAQTARSIHDIVLGPRSVQTDTEGLYEDNYEPIWFLVKMTETLRYADSDVSNGSYQTVQAYDKEMRLLSLSLAF